MKHLYALTIASLGLTGLLTGCDGGTITYTPNSPDNSSVTTTSTTSTASSVISSSSISIISAPSSTPSSTSSSTSSSVDDCAIGTAGAPACYAITPSEEQCAMGDCEVEAIISDYCGTRNLEAELLFYSNNPDLCQSYSSLICRTLEGRTYYSTTLEEGDLSGNGPSKMHWQVNFNEGQLNVLQAGFIISGTYRCENNQLITTLDNGNGAQETVLNINEALTQFTLDTIDAGEVTYAYSEQQDLGSCPGVAGNRYSTPPSNSTNPEEGPTFFEFAASTNTVIYGYSDIRESGYYDCGLGQLHVHLDSNPEPLVLRVNRHAVDITLLGNPNIILPQVNVNEPAMCTQEYTPVCAAKTVQCATESCYPIHTTYGNQCEADNSPILFEGECGAKEGQAVIQEPTTCPAIYAPVCAKVTADIQCVTTPCPSHQYKTFSNDCNAGGNALISFNGTCDSIKLDRQLSFEQQPARLYNFNAGSSLPANLPSTKGVTVIEATIKDDILIAKLGYSGCNEQTIHLNVDASVILTSFPEQVSYAFSKSKEDLCEAYFETTYEYDLLPIRANFRALVEGNTGLAVAGELYKR